MDWTKRKLGTKGHKVKTASKTATVTTAYSQVLEAPIKFSYTYQELEKGDEIPEDERLDADDIRNAVNAKRNSAARAKEQTAQFEKAGIKKPDMNLPEEQFKQMVKWAVASGKSQEVAEQLAKAALGLD